MRAFFKIMAVWMLQICLLSGCAQRTEEPPKSNWGSFTAEDTYSYDKKYVAVQTVETEEYSRTTKVRYVRVTIMDANREKLRLGHCRPLHRRGRGTSGGYAGRATATISGRSPVMWVYSAINMRTKRGCGMNPPSARRRLFPNMISPGVCSVSGMERG